MTTTFTCSIICSLANDLKVIDIEELEYKAFIVDISSLKETDLGFNHAGCQCGSINFQLDDYFNVQSYPILDNVSIILKEDENRMLGWTCYGGIAAL